MRNGKRTQVIGRTFAGALALCFLAAIVHADPPAATVDSKTVAAYLRSLGVTPERVGENELRVQAKAKGAVYDVLVKVDPEHRLVYVALTDLMPLRASDPAADAVCRKIASMNYDLTLGKLEWNEEGAEVRLSYSFTTENGLGREAFTGLLGTLLLQAGPARAELRAAAAL